MKKLFACAAFLVLVAAAVTKVSGETKQFNEAFDQEGYAMLPEL